MTGQRIGYIRVSTFDQNTDRQLDSVQVSKTFIDKASGISLIGDYIWQQSKVMEKSEFRHLQRQQNP